MGYTKVYSQTHTPSMPKIIPFDRALRPALPVIRGNVDYLSLESELFRINELLRQSGIEDHFITLCIDRLFEGSTPTDTPEPRAHQIVQAHKQASRAIRCMVLKALLGEGFRGLSRRIAECQLFQWFCEVDELVVDVPSKSTLQRYSEMLPPERIAEVIDALTLAAAGGKEATVMQPLELANAVELDVVWMDSTCIKANIHFPVDWVLLSDAARTLLKAIALIRRHGLKHRMPEPEVLMSQMNRLSITMTHARRTLDSKKARKRTLRSMKTLVRVIACHAKRYAELLEAHWAETDWSHAQAKQVLARIHSVVAKLPAAIEQAHERIIGERQLPNHKKRLSLYEEEIHVIVRGKAGGEVEFGNTLFLAEQADGLIIDFEFSRSQAVADSRWLPKSLARIESLIGRCPVAVTTDRGFESKANRDLLANKEIVNGMCPRDPAELRRRKGDEIFAALQRRRAQTEGRIGIFKNKMLAGLLRAKGYENRARAIAWAVLAHNLWVLARMDQRVKPVPEAVAA